MRCRRGISSVLGTGHGQGRDVGPARRLARLVRQTVPDVRFVVCGDGELLAETVERAAADGLDVTFLRWRSDVETVYAAADLVLLTSDNEGMVALLEDGQRRSAMESAARVFTQERFGSERLVRDIAGLYTRIAFERGWWPHGRQPGPQGGALAADPATHHPAM